MAPTAPRIATANALLSGETVYLDRRLRWVRDIRASGVAATPEAAARLRARAAGDAALVVGARLIEVELDADGTPRPHDFRERARVDGPNVGPVRFPG